MLYDIWEADILSQYATDLSCVIPFLEYTLLCSECGEQFYFKHEAFLNKAKTTNDKIDDLIFQLLLDAVGDYNSWDVPSINQHDCDLCWHSNLGNGITLKLFKQLNEIWALYDNLTGEKPAIMPIMERMENYLFYTMTTGTYMNTQKKVLGEYEKIAAIFQGRAIDKSRFTDFSKLKNDLISGSGFTFDCANKDCATMVMKEAFPDN